MGTGKTRLYGEPMGISTYSNIKGNINYSKYNIINFADNIEDISISFVKGFTKEIFKKIKIDEFNTYFKIEGRPRVRDKFYKSIYY
ncbi:hypothetical protein [Metaclostridioides mangenotii]|uniref:hypothetical protein n=1 Tax=Metaclostridioides mangenotii TaxID=1540 RepID=UPI000465DC8B|nr:hypothetical protein [Clostridioides mangenotii]